MTLFARISSDIIITLVVVLGIGLIGGAALGWVERVSMGACCMWPLAVAINFERCLRTNTAVSPGHVVFKSALMASIYMVGTGLNTALCRYPTMSLFFCIFIDVVTEVVGGA